ncbi:serine hydrolase domain-containing protein [Zhihengliuella salsuginis]|uniref:Serine hydrolase n=1 Tax=Zhihengliuella salsuginis TaxID=578222 RepID=A0ABQ3GDP2_9MICC|nr:serine hydrolase domain-containing protein [Zhihengliuella salsuginis]GHD02398.1 serine hydrolase [Zhihengliuella salsuginis]
MTPTDPRFAPVAELFERFAQEDPAYAGQLALYYRGEPVLDLSVGPDRAPQARPEPGGDGGAEDPAFTREVMTGVFSCSKGAAGVVMALLVQDGVLDLDAPVAAYWPEYGQAGKEATTVRQALSHQAGSLGVAGGFTVEEYNNSQLAAARLAAAPPNWRPGAVFSYHGLSIGILMEELVRRITGSTLQEVYEERIRAPHGIDFYLGLPESEEPRYRDVLKPEAGPLPFIDPFGYLGTAFNSTGGFTREDGEPGELLDLPNDRAIRAAGMSSAGGVANARGLARLYAAASTGIVGEDGTRSEPLLTEHTQTIMAEDQVFGPDRADGLVKAFGVVFMKPTPEKDFGSWRVFGHEGANGSFGYADPSYGIAFGYVPARGEDGGTLSRNGQLSVRVRQAVLQALAGG